MPIRVMFRRSPAMWISPLLMLFTISYAKANLLEIDPYILALTVAGASMVMLVAPVCAACAAWEGARLRRANWWLTIPYARSTYVVVLTALAPVFVVGLVTITAVIFSKTLEAGIGSIPDFRIVALAFLIVAAHILLGFSVGVSVPAVVAVPAVLLVDFAWLGIPPSLHVVWLRHLTGAWTGCCSISTDIAPQAIMGALVVAVGLAGSAVLLMRNRRGASQVALAIMPTLLAVCIGSLLVHNLGPDPVVDRKASLVCSSGQPRVCVWPEHRMRIEEASAIATEASAAWQAIGIPVPAEFSEQRVTALPPGASSFRLSSTSQRNDIISSLAYGLLPQPPLCARAGTAPWPGGAAMPYVMAWLVEVTGVPRGDIAGQFGPDVLRTVEKVQSLPVAQQMNWMERNVAAIGECSVDPQLDFST